MQAATEDQSVFTLTLTRDELETLEDAMWNAASDEPGCPAHAVATRLARMLTLSAR